MMESFVRDPLRAAGHVGKATTALFLVAVLVFHAPAWVLGIILFGLPNLFLWLYVRAEEQAEERERGKWRRPESNRRPRP
jgi:hypothetical protein